jgi:hypothetical protein
VSRPKICLTDLESPTYNFADPANGGVDYAKGMKSMTAVTADGRVVLCRKSAIFRIVESVGL